MTIFTPMESQILHSGVLLQSISTPNGWSRLTCPWCNATQPKKFHVQTKNEYNRCSQTGGLSCTTVSVYAQLAETDLGNSPWVRALPENPIFGPPETILLLLQDGSEIRPVCSSRRSTVPHKQQLFGCLLLLHLLLLLLLHDAWADRSSRWYS